MDDVDEFIKGSEKYKDMLPDDVRNFYRELSEISTDKAKDFFIFLYRIYTNCSLPEELKIHIICANLSTLYMNITRNVDGALQLLEETRKHIILIDQEIRKTN